MLEDVLIYLSGKGSSARRSHHQIIVNGVTYALFLCGRGLTVMGDLVFAALNTRHGRSTIPSIFGPGNVTQSVYRLRKSLDDAVEVDGFGEMLVENLHFGEYRLTIPPPRLIIGPGFGELTPHHLSQSVVSGIVKPALPAPRPDVRSYLQVVANHVLVPSIHDRGFSNPFRSAPVDAPNGRLQDDRRAPRPDTTAAIPEESSKT